MSNSYRPLLGNIFFEGFLVDLKADDWPNRFSLTLWSSVEDTAYRLRLSTILEHHFIRSGVGKLLPEGDPIPLNNVYTSDEPPFGYWCNKIGAFERKGLDDGLPPHAIILTSHLFASRTRRMDVGDRELGIIFVCREYEVAPILDYSGPQPHPHRIPAG